MPRTRHCVDIDVCKQTRQSKPSVDPVQSQGKDKSHHGYSTFVVACGRAGGGSKRDGNVSVVKEPNARQVSQIIANGE